jgi:hypothetical protein
MAYVSWIYVMALVYGERHSDCNRGEEYRDESDDVDHVDGSGILPSAPRLWTVQ